MSKNRVAIVRYQKPLESVRRAVELCNGLDHLPSGARVFIKPNIVFWTKLVPFPKWGVITTTRVVEDVILLLKELSRRSLAGSCCICGWCCPHSFPSALRRRSRPASTSSTSGSTASASAPCATASRSSSTPATSSKRPTDRSSCYCAKPRAGSRTSSSSSPTGCSSRTEGVRSLPRRPSRSTSGVSGS